MYINHNLCGDRVFCTISGNKRWCWSSDSFLGKKTPPLELIYWPNYPVVIISRTLPSALCCNRHSFAKKWKIVKVSSNYSGLPSTFTSGVKGLFADRGDWSDNRFLGFGRHFFHHLTSQFSSSTTSVTLLEEWIFDRHFYSFPSSTLLVDKLRNSSSTSSTHIHKLI